MKIFKWSRKIGVDLSQVSIIVIHYFEKFIVFMSWIT
jgi:hypothetical protein